MAGKSWDGWDVKKKRGIAKPGAATTDNNNGGRGLNAYRRKGLGRGPRDGSGPQGIGASTTDENNKGKGLDSQSPPRKRKPQVAKPKNWNRR